MKRVFIIALCSLLLTGCVVKKEMTAIGGSKADGTVKMGYIFGAFEIPQVDVYQASELAAKKMLRVGIYRG